MNTTKLIQLSKQYSEIEGQIFDLKSGLESIESEIEEMVVTSSAPTRAAASAPSTRKRKSKKRRKRNYKRKTPAGDEVNALAELIMDHFKKNPDTEICPVDLYDVLGLSTTVDKSRTRCALGKLRGGRYISLVRRGVYVLHNNQPGGERGIRAADDERRLIMAMEPGKPMHSKEILSRVNPPSYRYHALESRLWMMARAGKLKKIERGVYQLISN